MIFGPFHPSSRMQTATRLRWWFVCRSFGMARNSDRISVVKTRSSSPTRSTLDAAGRPRRMSSHGSPLGVLLAARRRRSIAPVAVPVGTGVVGYHGFGKEPVTVPLQRIDVNDTNLEWPKPPIAGLSFRYLSSFVVDQIRSAVAYRYEPVRMPAWPSHGCAMRRLCCARRLHISCSRISDLVDPTPRSSSCCSLSLRPRLVWSEVLRCSSQHRERRAFLVAFLTFLVVDLVVLATSLSRAAHHCL